MIVFGTLARFSSSGVQPRMKTRRTSISIFVYVAILSAWSSVFAENRVALIIGSNLAPPGKAPLRYAHRDARHVRNVLVQYGSLAPNQVQFLLDPTPDAIRSAIGRVEASASASGEPATLIFYYSGHADREALLLGKQKLPFEEITSLLKDSRYTLRVGIVDACQSGALTTAKGGTRVKGFKIRWESTPKIHGAILITSSSAEEASIESDDIGGSLFSHFLVSGMRGAADSNQDGNVTLSEIFRYAYANTVSRSADTRSGVQHPTYDYQLTGQAEYVLTRPGQHASAFVFPEGLEGSYLIFDRSRDEIVAEVHKERDRVTRVSVMPGDYYIKKREPSHVLLAKVSIKKARDFEVDDSKMYTVPFEEDVTKGHLSPSFRPTWAYGAPPIRNTAYTLRRNEWTIGLFHPIAWGVNDSVTLMTSPWLYFLLEPNLGARFNLYNGGVSWSLEASYSHSFRPFLDDSVADISVVGVVPSKRSEIKFGLGSSVTIPLGHFVHLTFGGLMVFESLPYEQVDVIAHYEGEYTLVERKGIEGLGAGGKASFLFLLGEHNMLELSGVATYLLALPVDLATEDRLNWQSMLLYAHAWDVFRLGVGAIYTAEMLDRKLPPFPIIDVWWRF